MTPVARSWERVMNELERLQKSHLVEVQALDRALEAANALLERLNTIIAMDRRSEPRQHVSESTARDRANDPERLAA
jgi:hypothetical protein